MSELMEVFEPGDRFATIDRKGRVLVWQVNEHGIAHVMPGQFDPPAPAPFPDRDDRPHSRACGITRHDHGTDCSPDCPTCCGNAP
jgi:hypothetical protein